MSHGQINRVRWKHTYHHQWSYWHYTTGVLGEARYTLCDIKIPYVGWKESGQAPAEAEERTCKKCVRRANRLLAKELDAKAKEAK